MTFSDLFKNEGGNQSHNKITYLTTQQATSVAIALLYVAGAIHASPLLPYILLNDFTEFLRCLLDCNL